MTVIPFKLCFSALNNENKKVTNSECKTDIFSFTEGPKKQQHMNKDLHAFILKLYKNESKRADF